MPPSPTKSAESLVKKTSKPLNMKKSYMQASKANISSNIKYEETQDQYNDWRAIKERGYNFYNQS